MARDHQAIVQQGLQLKKAGNRIVALISAVKFVRCPLPAAVNGRTEFWTGFASG
jgi:hypothetical protein